MAGLIDNRKRSREDDYHCDSTPLSKRINNLHLSNHEEHIAANGLANSSSSSIQHTNGEQQQAAEQQRLSDCRQHHQQQQQQQSANEYNPELNESQNPFYYLKNKFLHELHFERLKRCTT